jgi:glycosyltransferase involved in cell wall biosynthesis
MSSKNSNISSPVSQLLVAPALLRWKTVNLSPQIPVAVFITGFHPGGTERQMIELVRRLDRARFRVHVACFHRDGAWLPRVTECAATLVEFPIRGFARPGTLAQLSAFARWCRREQIQVVQTCDLYANTFGLPGAAMAGVPVRIGSRRELNPDKSPGQIALQRLAYRAATKVVANSRAAREILEREGLARESIAVIPNGVDLASYRAGRPVRQIRTVATVANLRHEKGHETLIAAAAALVPNHPSLRFRIIGDGPRRTDLEALVRAHGLAAHVEFLGHREDVPALLAEADLFVLPSRSEAFPNGAIEAMASALPVVASATGGLLDLIEHGRTGILVPAGDSNALAGAIGALIAAPERAADLGAAAREDVQQRFSFERMVSAFEDVYLSSLPGRATDAVRHIEAAGI